VSVQGCETAYVVADRIRLKQVLLNLLSNAVKYNRDGGRISVSCEPLANHHLLIKVTDTGAGIEPQDIPHLFEPFSRLYLSTYAKDGTGIGLTIAKQLVERMGGRIGVDSEPGRGSTFWIELPQSDNPPTAIPSETRAISSQNSEHRHKILYIEDSPSHVTLVERILDDEPGIALITAASPQSGLELASSHNPDLILLDIDLPSMDGFEVYERLQAGEDTASIPVVALSANALRADIDKALRAGFSYYLTKPIKIMEFKQIVHSVLRAGEARGE
jgi:two-component system sensor histidine kinase/response regulator